MLKASNIKRNATLLAFGVAIAIVTLYFVLPREKQPLLSVAPDGTHKLNLPDNVKPDADGVIRLAITDDMRNRHQQEMAKLVGDYFAMSPADRLAHLDQQIALHEQARKFAGNQPPTSGSVNVETSTTQSPGQEPKWESKRIEIKDNAGPKSMMENLDPQTRAQLADYLKDMNARRAEKGLPPAPGIMIIKMETRTETRPNQGG